jgi:hypothetical protein
VDDQQVRPPAVARVHLEGDDLQFTPSFVGPDIEPGIGTTGRGDRGRFGGARTYRAEARPMRCLRAD